MAKWGLGLTRKEILEVVGRYVNTHALKTPFKDGVTGKYCFIFLRNGTPYQYKKPESLEYARKKAGANPFIVENYFDLLQ